MPHHRRNYRNSQYRSFYEDFKNSHPTIVRFLRRNERRRKGVTVAFKDKDGVVRVGYSQLNKIDALDRDDYYGFKLAVEKSVPIAELDMNKVYYDVYEDVERIKRSAIKYFKLENNH